MPAPQAGRAGPASRGSHLITGGPGGAARGAGHAPAPSARRPRASAGLRARLSPARGGPERQDLAPCTGRIPGRRGRHSGEVADGLAVIVGPSPSSSFPEGRAWAAEQAGPPPDTRLPGSHSPGPQRPIFPSSCWTPLTPLSPLGAHLPTRLPAAYASAQVPGPQVRETPSQLCSAAQPNCAPSDSAGRKESPLLLLEGAMTVFVRLKDKRSQRRSFNPRGAATHFHYLGARLRRAPIIQKAKKKNY
ncbi:transcription initiation factor TFIID subunit 4-like [Sturnira hondurensis]|uniref:transcription initiation factor TFIID subunit 4-like n=1 Tax=Sturnira hondurensis TaxID=192404 RepID=UPI001879CAF6|nr:transcription initiation factor TFIID subunit 4-like [Sturnira hondurensis]